MVRRFRIADSKKPWLRERGPLRRRRIAPQPLRRYVLTASEHQGIPCGHRRHHRRGDGTTGGSPASDARRSCAARKIERVVPRKSSTPSARHHFDDQSATASVSLIGKPYCRRPPAAADLPDAVLGRWHGCSDPRRTPSCRTIRSCMTDLEADSKRCLRTESVAAGARPGRRPCVLGTPQIRQALRIRCALPPPPAQPHRRRKRQPACDNSSETSPWRLRRWMCSVP